MSFVITIDPCPTKFVGDMVDMIVSTDEENLDFKLKQGDDVILEENYVPADGTIRIGGLGRVIDGILYGQLIQEGAQDYAKGTFQFIIGETVALTKTLYASHQRNLDDATGAKKVLSHGKNDVCYPDIEHPITFIGAGTARLKAVNGTTIASASVGWADIVYTSECQPAQLFPDDYQDGARIEYTVGSDTFTSHIDHTRYPDSWLFRFLNMYDVPETLLAKKAIEVKPNETHETGVINGVQRRFDITADDEYTVESGALPAQWQYDTWRDLLMSRLVEVKRGDVWLPVIITKLNYKRTWRAGDLENVQFSFKMADYSNI